MTAGSICDGKFGYYVVHPTTFRQVTIIQKWTSVSKILWIIQGVSCPPETPLAPPLSHTPTDFIMTIQRGPGSAEPVV